MTGKTFTPYPLQGHWGKIAGFYISTITGLALLIGLLAGFESLIGMSQKQFVVLLLGIITFGLYMMAFSKEKIEDERTRLIRARGLQIAFQFIISPILIFSTFDEFDSYGEGTDLSLILVIVFLGLLIYNLYFNYTLRNDSKFSYGEESTPMDNLKSKGGRILLLIFAVLFIVFLTKENWIE